MRRAVRVSPASARTCRGGLKRAGPDGVRASGPGRGRVGVVSRSVLCVGCGRDQGLGAVPADISGEGGGRKISRRVASLCRSNGICQRTESVNSSEAKLG